MCWHIDNDAGATAPCARRVLGVSRQRLQENGLTNVQRFTLLQQKIEAAEERAEAAEAENKKVSYTRGRSKLTVQYQQTLLERDQEISSLQHKLSLAEEEADKAEEKLKELKGSAEEGDTHRTASENYQRKVQLLEEELDKAEKDLKETTEKLRQVDVKAEHFERAFQRAEQERDEWERKHGVSTHSRNLTCAQTHEWRHMAHCIATRRLCLSPTPPASLHRSAAASGLSES